MDLLSNEILIHIYLNLNINEAKKLSLTSKKYYNIYKYLINNNKYLNINFFNRDKIFKFILLGFRYINFNNQYYKIINIKNHMCYYKIYTYNGYIIYINEKNIKIYHYKIKNIKYESIKLIINSNFNIKSRPILIK